MCRCCGRSRPVDSEVVERWAERTGADTGFAAVEHTVELTGICADCQLSGGRRRTTAMPLGARPGPSPQLRVAKCGRATWIGWTKADDHVDDLLRWATVGGPGLAQPPATLELQFICAPGEARTRARGRGRGRARR